MPTPYAYKAVMFDAQTGAQNTYVFSSETDLMTASRMQLIDAFMHYVDHVELPRESVGYEIQTALKNRDMEVVTAVGLLKLQRGEIPFMVMISRADNGA
ncbi:hypothetical protein [Pararhodospirillum oryzae]|uniref:Uncharacterized protein n=1 Tax=Pararhodospirillum oryzae TaxID=478448 RepID=A0A512H6K9_9PROT|nr:hypothetical protein [Pararhodospirillum oryzae]GEO81020.1 hypothetical protein ROR02_11510 [Pararhodospirillum oryzae]